MITAAAVVPSPPLLARELTGRQVVLPELREACAVAVGRLLAGSADVVAVVGAGPRTTAWDSGARLNLLAWGPMARGARGETAAAGETAAPGKPGLPLALGIGAALLDEAGYAGPRVLRAIDGSASAADCLAAGAEIASLGERVALLAVGDGSARCTPAAPGYFDERAEGFTACADAALRSGDMAALAALDASLAAELMATGRAAWQVLAGAVGPRRRAPGDVLYAGAPFGVAYLVAVLDLA
ncbi:MAG TPA: hypothetical protein VMG38_07190 [Trebonia sp.]|nr:hypothetical protein [Trebonia sp.]